MNAPEWRTKAQAGISLAEAMTRSGMTFAAVPMQDKRTASPELSRILLPNALPQWRSRRVSYYTPEMVEFVLGNAMAGDLHSQWELFDLMEDTWPRLAKNLSEIKRAVAAMQWSVRPWSEDDAPPTPEAELRAKLVSHVIWKMRPDPTNDERDFGGLVYDLLDAWSKGISVVELIWEERQSERFGLHWAPLAAIWVAPRYYALSSSGQLGLKIEHTQAPGITGLPTNVQEFPDHKFLVGVAKARTTHMATAAMLRPLAWWWAASNFSAQWLLNYAQLFGVPMRWATYSEGASLETVTKIGEALADMGSSAWGAFPEGTNLNILEGTKTAGLSPQDGVIDRADKYCDLLVLGQTLTTDATDTGTQALGTVHERVRGDVIQSAADWVAGVLNQQMVQSILTLTFGNTDDAPELQAEPVRQKDEQAAATRIATLLGAGVEIPKKWLHEHLDIPLPQEGEETVGGRSNLPQDEFSHQGGIETPDEEEKTTAAATAAHQSASQQVSAARSTPKATDPAVAVDELVRQAVAESVGVRTRWLEPLAQEMDRLIQAAQGGALSDEALRTFLEQARANLPDLFSQLDVGALSDHLERYLGAAVLKAVKAKV